MVLTGLLCLSVFAGTTLTPPHPLSVIDAERIAISSAPEIQRLQDNTQALKQQAIANRQLSDPKLIAGAINVPTNTFSFNQDDMTMVEVGLEQYFPPGHSLAMKSNQTRALATAEKRKAAEKTIMILQNVRDTWLDLYYWTHAANIVRSNRTLMSFLLKSSQSQYSTGKDNLSNVLQVKLERSRLDDQLDQIHQSIDILRAQLARWIGQNQADQKLSTLPKWPNPPSLTVMQTQLQRHPLLKVDSANVIAASDEVAFAKEQFKPGFTVGLDYGVRQGNMMDANNGMPVERSNMITAQVSMDLQLFTHNRQSRRLRASSYQLQSAQLERQVHYRDLLKALREQYALFQQLSLREKIYSRHLIPVANQNSKAAMLAYRSATTDLATVLRAYTGARNIKLEQLQIKIERYKARSALLYLQGLSQ